MTLSIELHLGDCADFLHAFERAIRVSDGVCGLHVFIERNV